MVFGGPYVVPGIVQIFSPLLSRAAHTSLLTHLLTLLLSSPGGLDEGCVNQEVGFLGVLMLAWPFKDEFL